MRFITEHMPIAAREMVMKTMAPHRVGMTLKIDVGEPVEKEGRPDDALVRAEGHQDTSGAETKDAADDEPEAGKAPDQADTGGAALEHDLAEEREEDLRGAAAGGPADAQHRNGEDQRLRLHVARALAELADGRAADMLRRAIGQKVALRHDAGSRWPAALTRKLTR